MKVKLHYNDWQEVTAKSRCPGRLRTYLRWRCPEKDGASTLQKMDISFDYMKGYKVYQVKSCSVLAGDIIWGVILNWLLSALAYLLIFIMLLEITVCRHINLFRASYPKSCFIRQCDQCLLFWIVLEIVLSFIFPSTGCTTLEVPGEKWTMHDNTIHCHVSNDKCL